jgi:hypothetical protein
MRKKKTAMQGPFIFTLLIQLSGKEELFQNFVCFKNKGYYSLDAANYVIIIKN